MGKKGEVGKAGPGWLLCMSTEFPSIPKQNPKHVTQHHSEASVLPTYRYAT